MLQLILHVLSAGLACVLAVLALRSSSVSRKRKRLIIALLLANLLFCGLAEVLTYRSSAEQSQVASRTAINAELAAVNARLERIRAEPLEQVVVEISYDASPPTVVMLSWDKPGYAACRILRVEGQPLRFEARAESDMESDWPAFISVRPPEGSPNAFSEFYERDISEGVGRLQHTRQIVFKKQHPWNRSGIRDYVTLGDFEGATLIPWIHTGPTDANARFPRIDVELRGRSCSIRHENMYLLAGDHVGQATITTTSIVKAEFKDNAITPECLAYFFQMDKNKSGKLAHCEAVFPRELVPGLKDRVFISMPPDAVTADLHQHSQ